MALSLGFRIGQAAKCLAQKGNLVYEYNPLKTLRISTAGDSELGSEPPGALLDLDTQSLEFDLNHPVDIVTQQSYDGSVNLILNDGEHEPRLINSRFSVTGMGTYQIVDREGDNDTNIYDKESFNTDTSLYKRATTIAKINFITVSSGGNLKVGNYNFYFKLADADGNETDFIGESGVVSCYIGNLNDPHSINGGIRDQSSFKAVHFELTNLDASYDHVVVYYTRSSSDNLNNKATVAYKILKEYPIYGSRCKVRVNGYEDQVEVSINDINIQYNIVNSCYTQDTAQNMLFMGNVSKTEIPYRELADLSLRIYPTLDQSNNIGFVSQDYSDSTGKFEYYNVQNIYHRLGYWDDEIYRFGVVYIMKDFTLSPVFNVRGGNMDIADTFTEIEPVMIGGVRQYVAIDRETSMINVTDNSKGVFRIKASQAQIRKGNNGVFPIGIKFRFYDQSNLFEELKKYTIGCFFVRQTRIATTLCQAVTIGTEIISHLPTLPVKGNKYVMESFLNKNRLLTHNFGDRKVELPESTIKPATAAICPEYELDYAFFNQLFTGSKFHVKRSLNDFSQKYCNVSGQHFYNLDINKRGSDDQEEFRVVAVKDSQAIAKNKNSLYSALAGTAEEGFRVSYYKYKNASDKATNLLRGAYGPFLGLEGDIDLPYAMNIIDIKIPNYSEANMGEYFQIRYQDSSPFFPISDRTSWDDLDTDKVYFRGDCYIGNFTHRMVRNFADPTAPYNDDIVDPNSWADNMDLSDVDSFNKINRGDVNAVKIGHWFTVKVCSNINISLRSTDMSFASEAAITNKPRAFYPLYAMNTSGENKVPESNVYNKGYSNSLSSKYNYEFPHVPAIKNVFITRIMYSNTSITDAFRNGYRVFELTNFRDYALTYGALKRIVEWRGNLLAVFEHGICLIPINERAVAGRGAGGNVFINTSNVLPENPKVISDMYGSQWSESIVKTMNYVYGIDTVAKKIWRTNGETIELLSDAKIQKFLNDNITLTETETTPIIGIKNVKSHYNAYKQDVMFTFYDDINTIEEKVWNLCYNEVVNEFVTFYSWVPSYTANIDNIMFSFDRTTSKTIAKLTEYYPKIYLIPANFSSYNGYRFLGILGINGEGDSKYKFELYDDNSNNKHRYKVEYQNGNYCLYVTEQAYQEMDIWTAAVKAELRSSNSNVEANNLYISGVLYGTVSACKPAFKESLTTHFWKHGFAGLMKHKEIKPCFWYGKQHPFEFEFVVHEDVSMHKIFNNLVILSNKAKPESFHFEVIGETYDFASDKLNMYCRQEATKQLYQWLGSDIKFNRNYQNLDPKQTQIVGSSYYQKSTYFPLYYQRKETLEEIYNTYTQMKGNESRDYCHLSGSEIIYDPQLSEFRIATHIKACPLDGYEDIEISRQEYEYMLAHYNPLFLKVYAWQDENTTRYYKRLFYGRIRGNCEYQEDKWTVQIPSITFMQKNESKWQKPPIIIAKGELPNDLATTAVTIDSLPEGYTIDDIQVLPNVYNTGDTIGGWTLRKETKIRDKWIKIRIRYTGDELAVINAIKTIYTESYA